MKTSIKTFLADLYEIDPTLKEHEADIVPLVEQLLASDPAQAPDKQFVEALRMQLRNRAGELSEAPASVGFWSKFTYAFSGALAVAVLLPVAYLGFQNGAQDSVTPGEPLFGYKVEEQGPNAFGSLSDIAQAAQTGMGGDAGNQRTQSGGGGGGGQEGLMAQPTTDIGNPATTVPMDAKMIAWPINQYYYTYEGELPTLEPSVKVFRRVASAKRIPLSALTQSLNMGIVDIATFSGLNMESLSFNQSTPFGYQVYVDLRNATVSVNPNWEQWPQSKCATEDCYKAEQTKISQIIPDADLIAIAKKFAEDHDINLSDYGEPAVDNSWKVAYDAATDKSSIWIPDQQRVTFPFMVEGKPVHDQGGVTSGISMGINVKHKRVSDIYGIMDRTYDSSSYTGVTDEKAIRDYISKVDNFLYPIDARPRGMEGGEGKKVNVTLDTPVVGYAMYYRWTNNENQELVVPSLIFPVKSSDGDKDGYYRHTVVVPLAKDMLAEQAPNGVMPLMMEDGAKAEPATDAVAPTTPAPDAVVNPAQ